jgi:hypothetical protein
MAVPDPKKTLFKYMPLQTAEIVLSNRTLRWTTPERLNDPHDMRFSFKSNVNKTVVKSSALEKMWETYSGQFADDIDNVLHRGLIDLKIRRPRVSREEFFNEFDAPIEESIDKHARILAELSTKLRDFVSDSKILCLTEDNSSTRMWSHYADDHKGITLGFRSIPGLDSPYQIAKRVTYHETTPDIFEAEQFADVLSGRSKLDTEEILTKYVYCKSTEWSYEREWRIFSGSGRNPDWPFEDIPFHQAELSEITFGCKMKIEDQVSVVALAKRQYPKARLSRVVMTDGSFDLSVRSI